MLGLSLVLSPFLVVVFAEEDESDSEEEIEHEHSESQAATPASPQVEIKA